MFRLPEEGAPATPPAGKISVYAKVDSKLYFKDDAGVEHELLDSTGATFTGPVLFDTVADIASAPSIDLTAYGSGFIATVTGTTPIEALVMSDGQFGTLKAAGALPLTYHATTNKLSGGGDAVLAAGDLIRVEKTGGVVTSEVVKASPSVVRLHTTNGYSSTNTAILRFATVVTNTGSDITYADSATLGASFTINTADYYTISFSHIAGAASNFGISVNSTQLTTSCALITDADRLCLGFLSGAEIPQTVCTRVYLPADSVIRAHGDGAALSAAPERAQFTITKG